MEIISLLTGILIGITIAYAFFYLLNKTKTVSKKEFRELASKHQEAITGLRLLGDRSKTLQITNDNLSERIEAKDQHAIQLQTRAAALETQLDNCETKIAALSQRLIVEEEANKSRQNEINLYKQKNAELIAVNNSINDSLSKQNDLIDKQTGQIEVFHAKFSELTSQASVLNANNTTLSERLKTQKTEIEELQRTAHLQFEKIANKLFEEKSSKFTETNKANIETLLNPLKEDINKFKTKVEETYDKESKQRFSLEEKVKDLIEQTNKVSAEANNLATALKGKPQKRGSWGEMILERILESSGLTRGREYFVQQSIKDEAGNNLRPDVSVTLPDERIIIIDSKVSLIAYDKFSASENIDEQRIFLAEHIQATKLHIDQLSTKRYDDIESSLDFTMMFVPIEPAYLLAIQGDPELWSYAYSKRILLVSPTNLIACLKLIADLWKREWQSKNAMEIVKKGEALYDKFVGFTKTFEEIGNSIRSSQEKYDKALGQLKDGRGNLINQAIQLKNLGLKSDKKVPVNMLPLEIEDEPASE